MVSPLGMIQIFFQWKFTWDIPQNKINIWGYEVYVWLNMMILIFICFNGIHNISVNFWMFEHISVDVLDPCFSLSWANMSGIFCLSDYSLLEPCCRISDIVSPELRKITISLLKSTWALKENIKYTTRRNKSLVMWCSSPGQLIWFHAAVKKWKSPSTWI